MSSTGSTRLKRALKYVGGKVLDNPREYMEAGIMAACGYMGYRAAARSPEIGVKATGAVVGVVGYKLATAGDPVAAGAGLIILATLGLLTPDATGFIGKAFPQVFGVIEDVQETLTIEERARALLDNPKLSNVCKASLMLRYKTMPLSMAALTDMVVELEEVLERVAAYESATGIIVPDGSVDGGNWHPPGISDPGDAR